MDAELQKKEENLNLLLNKIDYILFVISSNFKLIFYRDPKEVENIKSKNFLENEKHFIRNIF
jgi:hypothetical protein